MAQKKTKTKTASVKDETSEYEAKRKLIMLSHSNSIMRQRALAALDKQYQSGK